MNKVLKYAKDSYHEMADKVTWPTWSELQQSTAIVLLATVLITLAVGVMDFASNQIMKLIYSFFKS